MRPVILKEGDDAWIYMRNHNGNLTHGKVVKVIRLDGYSFDHYIIAIPTPVDDVLEIRSPSSVSDAGDKPIGMWRR